MTTKEYDEQRKELKITSAKEKEERRKHAFSPDNKDTFQLLTRIDRLH